MGEVITDLTRTRVTYLARDGHIYAVTLRNEYLTAMPPPFSYRIAPRDMPMFPGRPAQINIAASMDGVLVRRHIPFCNQNQPTFRLPDTFVADGLTWHVQSLRQEKMYSGKSWRV